MSARADALADRIEHGVQLLATFAEGLSQEEWQTICPDEKRPVGVLVHHVASAFPVELDLIQVLASGKAIEGVTWDMVDQMNADHAGTKGNCSKSETLELLNQNSTVAINAIRALSDDQLDNAAPISLNWDAPLTTQFFIEAHPVSHAFAHLVSIRAALKGKGAS
jgi:hypothetical protein